MTFRTHLPSGHPASHMPIHCTRCGERVDWHTVKQPCAGAKPARRCLHCGRTPIAALANPCHRCDVRGAA